MCDWDDAQAREALVDALVRDARAALDALDGHELSVAAADAAQLLALVAGQDVDEGDDKVFRIAQRVAADRTISTVDPRPATGTRATTAASTATRRTCRSTLTPSSSTRWW